MGDRQTLRLMRIWFRHKVIRKRGKSVNLYRELFTEKEIQKDWVDMARKMIATIQTEPAVLLSHGTLKHSTFRKESFNVTQIESVEWGQQKGGEAWEVGQGNHGEMGFYWPAQVHRPQLSRLYSVTTVPPWVVQGKASINMGSGGVALGQC